MRCHGEANSIASCPHSESALSILRDGGSRFRTLTAQIGALSGRGVDCDIYGTGSVAYGLHYDGIDVQCDKLARIGSRKVAKPHQEACECLHVGVPASSGSEKNRSPL